MELDEVAQLRFRRMQTTDARLRKQVSRVLHLGVSQRFLAVRIGMKPSAFNKWLHQKSGSPANLNHLDGFRAYVRELGEAAAQAEAALSTSEHPASVNQKEVASPQRPAAVGERRRNKSDFSE